MQARRKSARICWRLARTDVLRSAATEMTELVGCVSHAKLVKRKKRLELSPLTERGFSIHSYYVQ